MGMWSIPLVPLLQGQLWPGVVGLDRVPSMGQVKLFDFSYKQMTDVKLNTVT